MEAKMTKFWQDLGISSDPVLPYLIQYMTQHYNGLTPVHGKDYIISTVNSRTEDYMEDHPFDVDYVDALRDELNAYIVDFWDSTSNPLDLPKS
jgi:hypothetical protein